MYTTLFTGGGGRGGGTEPSLLGVAKSALVDVSVYKHLDSESREICKLKKATIWLTNFFLIFHFQSCHSI